MYPRVPWEMVEDPLGSAEDTLGTIALMCFECSYKLMTKQHGAVRTYILLATSWNVKRSTISDKNINCS